MDLYIIIFIIVTVLILLALGGFFFFVQWLDKKIDKKDRLGQTKKKTKSN